MNHATHTTRTRHIITPAAPLCLLYIDASQKYFCRRISPCVCMCVLFISLYYACVVALLVVTAIHIIYILCKATILQEFLFRVRVMRASYMSACDTRERGDNENTHREKTSIN